MDTDAQSAPHPSRHTMLWQREIETLATEMPPSEATLKSPRIFLVWGEDGIGKSTFISTLRESEPMRQRQALWLSPLREGKVDTPAEFILACAESVRFTSEPEKEKSISEKIESVQHGKISLLSEDNSMLIARSDYAQNKKPYINQAAAASVGRTERVDDDEETVVGLGENKANSLAEAFLDALPLASMDVEAIVLYLEKWDNLSATLQDWLRDYVFPAATKGQYRRNLIILLEAKEPSYLQSEANQWGDWSSRVRDFRLMPLRQAEVTALAFAQGISQKDAAHVHSLSLGYPAETMQVIKRLADLTSATSDWDQTIEELSESDRQTLATLSLPKGLWGEELNCLLGSGRGSQGLDWLAKQKGVALQQDNENSGFVLELSQRLKALRAAPQGEEMQTLLEGWLPYGRLLRNVPHPENRRFLFMLSTCEWLDDASIHIIFKDESDETNAFVDRHRDFFVHREGKFIVSETLRGDFRKIGKILGLSYIEDIRERASSLWKQRKSELDARTETLEMSIKETNQGLDKHSRAMSESQQRSRKRKVSSIYDSNTEEQAKKPDHARIIGGALTFAICGIVATIFTSSPINIIALIVALGSLCLSLALLPNWQRIRKAKQTIKRSYTPGTAERAQREALEAVHHIRQLENELDGLQRDLAIAQKSLRYPLFEQ